MKKIPIEYTAILVTAFTIVCIVLLSEKLSFLIICCSIIYSIYIFYSEAKQHIEQSNDRWIYPAILSCILFLIAYFSPLWIITKVFVFLFIIMFIRCIVNLILTVFIGITNEKITKAVKLLINDMQKELIDVKFSMNTSIVSITDLENNIHMINAKHEQRIANLIQSLNLKNKDLELVKTNAKSLKDQLNEYKKDIEQKNKDIIQMRNEQDEYIKALQEQNESGNYPLENKEIRNKFNEMLNIAKQEIDIFCPWITEKVVDELMQNKFRRLLDKGVSIKIRYGIGINNNDKKNKNTKIFAQKLSKKFSTYKNFKMYEDNSHVKLFICDDDFYVLSSFNILSFKGDYSGNDMRRELGEFSTNKKILIAYRNKYFNF